LILNGLVTQTAGTLTGGSSTNITFGGTGTNTILPSVILNNLTINRSNGITLNGDVTVGNSLTLTSGTLTLAENTFTLSGNILTRTSGNIDASNSSASLIFANSDAITLPDAIFTGNINNLKISGNGGLTSVNNLTVNGILDLSASNPILTPTKGIFDFGTYTLSMGLNATTIGIGDVTGYVSRTAFLPNIYYTFGNEFTTVSFAVGGIYPSELKVKIAIGNSPTWKLSAINRIYDFVQTGGNNCMATIKTHYLDAELNGNIESRLVQWTYGNTCSPPGLYEWGHFTTNATENWVSIANVNIGYFPTSEGCLENTLANSLQLTYIWNGSVSTDWTNVDNWSPIGQPPIESNVIIPDASTTPNDPNLPASTEIKTFTLEAGSILNAASNEQFTINGNNGAWRNLGGVFNSANSNVIFTNEAATIAGITDFYNITITDGKQLTLGTNSITRIAGAISTSSTGKLEATLLLNSIEYNGTNQTIINPNGTTSGYHNLILSGSGTKTMPATSLNILGDFFICGTASATASSELTIGGELEIQNGASFATGNYNHTVSGNFDNDGTFTASVGTTITLNGTSPQKIYGETPTTFEKLVINNISGVNILTNINVNNLLTLTSGNLNVGETTLGINGNIIKTAGFIEVNPLSSLSFGGTSALSLPNNLFSDLSPIKNLTIIRSGGIMLGNQNMTINNLLDLQSGTLNISSNILTIAGISPTSTTGNLDCSNSSSSLVFTNNDAIILPTNFFTGNVNNLTINATGGITSNNDFSIIGILNLQSENPSSTKGSLDMQNNTLTMGELATTVGLGDVTGIVRRTSFLANTEYSFGNEFTTISFLEGGTYPTEMNVKISIGTSPTWKTDAINRVYDFIHTGGDNCLATVSTHYLDTELNGNSENELVQWTFGTTASPVGLYEWGCSSFDYVNNKNSISNINIAYFPTSFGQLENTLSKSLLERYVWDGSESTDWFTVENWTPVGSPSSNSNIIIPDASTTLFSPLLPASADARTLTLEPAGILNASANTLFTIYGGNGAWSNCGGTYNPNTSNVIFTNSAATISCTNNFYDLTINTGAVLQIENGGIIRIAGAINNSGKLRTVIAGETTVEYNGGNQTVVIPNSATNRYSTLILSGTGIKTLPNSALEIVSDFILSGTSETTVTNNLTIVKNLTINSGSKLIISPLGNLTVNGILTNNANAVGFVIKSDATGTGSLIHYTANVPATVERFVTGNKWHFMFSPLTQVATSTYTAEGGYTNQNIYSYNESTTDYWNTTTNFGTTGWTPLSGTQYLSTTKGYIFNRYQMGNKTFSQTGGSLFVGTKDFLVTYKLNSGPTGNGVTQGWTTFDGWNLVGNPYTSAIDWNAITKTDIEAGVYFYVGNNYQYYINASGTSPWNVGITINGGSNIIPSGQGFFVKVNNTGATHSGVFSIPETARVPNSQPFYKSEIILPPNTIILSISQGSFSDETAIRTIPDATEQRDADYDAFKQFSWDKTKPQLFSLNSEHSSNYAINSLPEIETEKIVDLGVFIGTTGDYSLNNIDLTFSELNVYLEDKSTNTTTNLRAVSNYEFNSVAGTFYNRFSLHFSLNNPPVANVQNIEIDEDTELILNLANVFTDIDVSDILTLEFTQFPEWISNENLTLSGIPTNSEVGSYIIKMKATDLAGASTETQFTITVLNVNDAPTAQQPENIEIDEDTELNLDLGNVFTDVDVSEILTVEFTQIPEWISNENLTISGIPTNSEVGSYVVQMRATDLAGTSAETEFTITVLNINDFPIAHQPENIEINEDTELSLNLENVFIDIDVSDILTVEFTQIPEWITNKNLTLSGNPTNSEVGSYIIEMKATDLAGATTETEFTIEVLNINDIPIISVPLFDFNANVGSKITIDLDDNTFTDIDLDDVLTYSSIYPSWLNFETSTLTYSGIPIDEETVDILLTATDLTGVSVIGNFKIFVLPAILSIDAECFKIDIYPNPTTGIFNINLSEVQNLMEVNIKDISGKTIKSYTKFEIGLFSNYTIDLTDYANGIYYVEIITDIKTYGSI